MKKKELIRNKGYWIAKIQLDLFEELTNYMKKNNLTRTKLAKKLGVSKGYVTQVLNGDFDHRISKLVDLALSIEKIPIVKFEQTDELESGLTKHNLLRYKTINETTSDEYFIDERNIIVSNINQKNQRPQNIKYS